MPTARPSCSVAAARTRPRVTSARLLNAEKVEIWTDVAGMFSANPRQVPNARLLARLDYEEAQEIATTGAKVLHPRCINPCAEPVCRW